MITFTVSFAGCGDNVAKKAVDDAVLNTETEETEQPVTEIAEVETETETETETEIAEDDVEEWREKGHSKLAYLGNDRIEEVEGRTKYTKYFIYDINDYFSIELSHCSIGDVYYKEDKSTNIDIIPYEVDREFMTEYNRYFVEVSQFDQDFSSDDVTLIAKCYGNDYGAGDEYTADVVLYQTSEFCDVSEFVCDRMFRHKYGFMEHNGYYYFFDNDPKPRLEPEINGDFLTAKLTCDRFLWMSENAPIGEFFEELAETCGYAARVGDRNTKDPVVENYSMQVVYTNEEPELILTLRSSWDDRHDSYHIINYGGEEPTDKYYSIRVF